MAGEERQSESNAKGWHKKRESRKKALQGGSGTRNLERQTTPRAEKGRKSILTRTESGTAHNEEEAGDGALIGLRKVLQKKKDKRRSEKIRERLEMPEKGRMKSQEETNIKLKTLFPSGCERN